MHTEHNVIEDPSELDVLLATLEDNVEIPVNATTDETVQLIQDYSEVRFSLYYDQHSEEY